MTTPTDEPTSVDPAGDATPVDAGEAGPDGAVAPAPAPATEHHGISARDADLILARAHLRLGLLGLARAELETMAGRDELDDDGIRDLAEARWRTGDTSGAGEAAAAFLAVNPDDILALVVAAEAQADLGRPSEARRLAGRAMEQADGSLDPIFAGMRRSSIWPTDAGSGAGPAGVLFDHLHPSPIAPLPSYDRRTTDRHLANGGGMPHAPLDPALPAVFEAGPGLWDDQPGAALAADAAEVEPAELFHQAQAALDAGQTAEAATGLILALRSAPELAPAVLDLLSGRSEPILLLVRGDAEEVVGRHVDAMRDRASAASRVTATKVSSPVEPVEPVEVEPVEPVEPGEAATEPSAEATEPPVEPFAETAADPIAEPDALEPAAPEPVAVEHAAVDPAAVELAAAGPEATAEPADELPVDASSAGAEPAPTHEPVDPQPAMPDQEDS